MQIPQKTWLLILLVVQALCATFFLVDAVSDWVGSEFAGFRHLHAFEMVLSVALILGLVATIMLLRDLTRRQAEMRRQLNAASGAFVQVIERQFSEWGLSAAERDVAMLAIKGLSVAEMADLRRTKEGTVKAQSASVYRKAGVSGRLQLLSYFIDELLDGPLIEPQNDGRRNQP